MQGFEVKKRLLCAYPSPFLRIASILRILPFHAIATQGASRAKLTQGAALKRNGYVTFISKKAAATQLLSPQAGITAPTLTVMQGFEAKNR